jgi:hypothetical protein
LKFSFFLTKEIEIINKSYDKEKNRYKGIDLQDKVYFGDDKHKLLLNLSPFFD